MFHDQDTRVGKKGTTVRTFRIFLYSIWSDFAHIPNSGRLHGSNRELGTGNIGLLNRG